MSRIFYKSTAAFQFSVGRRTSVNKSSWSGNISSRFLNNKKNSYQNQSLNEICQRNIINSVRYLSISTKINAEITNNLTSTTSTLNHQHNQSKMSSSKMSTQSNKTPLVNLDNMNPNVVTMQYAVRGPIVIRAGEIEKELQGGAKKPFDYVIRANIGDCHAMQQQPITFLRQVLALTVCPDLLNSSNFPEDAKQRCRELLQGCHGSSIGSYTDSAGIEVIRRQVAEYIKKRDGFDADYLNIMLTSGATAGIKSLLYLLKCDTNNKPAGIMIPIPQYPLYSATLAEYGLHQVGYYLDESTNWGLNVSELQRSIKEARKTCEPRALCIINPGNPTGQVLTRQNIENIIKFAYDEKLFLLADEVYQSNVYDKNSEFHSFKKVIMEMGAPYCNMELASFMSASKGYLGECGIRGGYMEIVNMCPDVKAMLLKFLSASLCSTTAGQIAISCLVAPPKPGDPSYELYMKEKSHVLNSLKERAELVHKTFNSFEGFNCNIVQGAMYAFPQIKIPQKAIDAAKAKNMAPDSFYAFELLESAGVCIVPGSGFGQQPGTYHFRTTILPQTDKLKIMLEKFKEFHISFMNKYK